MKTYRTTQRSEEWYELRRGLPCASGFQYIITPKGVPTSGERRRAYMHRLIAERLLGYSMETRHINYWTQRGGEMEPQAMAAFAKQFGREVEDGEFFITNDFGTVGCSPDYILKSPPKFREGVEIKAPAPWTQVGYLLEGPGDNYRQQVQGQLLVGEFDVMHFYSYHPQMPPCHVRTVRDESFIEKLVKELAIFLVDLDKEEARVREMGTFTPGREARVEDLPGIFPWTGGNGNGGGREFYP